MGCIYVQVSKRKRQTSWMNDVRTRSIRLYTFPRISLAIDRVAAAPPSRHASMIFQNR
jgi:hypothetical protein